MKNFNNFTQWKNWSVDMMITRWITQQKYLAQSGHSTQECIVHFQYTVFTKEPIREQGIKFECMNFS